MYKEKNEKKPEPESASGPVFASCEVVYCITMENNKLLRRDRMCYLPLSLNLCICIPPYP